MKAAVCRAFNEPLVIEELTIEEPQAGELLVDVKACAICHSDITYMEGGWGGDLPALYGHEAAGIVKAVGPETPGVQVGDHVVVTLIRACGQCFYCSRGDRVMCEATLPLSARTPIRDASGASVAQMMNVGSFADQVLVHHSQIAVMPKDVDFAVASLLGCGVITGVGAAINTTHIAPGSSAVVIGTGGVGLNVIQGAALSGANPLIAIDVNDSKLEASRAFGATHVINSTTQDAAAEVKALTNGRMADHVFVSVGIGPAIEQGLGLMGKGAETVIVGMPPSGVTTTFDPSWLASDSQRIIGSKMGSAQTPMDIPQLVGLYRAGRLKLDELVTGTYPLEEINEAVASVKRGEALRNVVVF
ncbi:MAG: Zn-dependent alcohol dehydrogenase [Thermoleophilia bacterium]|nr:Zn-dependent alcohol dehydrogenase [Thermoleophilia bacterium]